MQFDFVRSCEGDGEVYVDDFIRFTQILFDVMRIAMVLDLNRVCSMNDGIYGYSPGPVIYNIPVMPKRPFLTMKLSMKFCIRFSAGSLYSGSSKV